MTTTSSTALLDSLLLDWKAKLQGWALDGSLASAAQQALVLNGSPAALQDLISQWSAEDFRSLPPVVLLSSAEMGGAMGAYAISSGTIYLNGDWLSTASGAQVQAVLTEELGHYLDGLLNANDTPGDEGETFSKLLINGQLSEADAQRLASENDQITITVAGQQVQAEAATTSPKINEINGSNLSQGDTNTDIAVLANGNYVVTWYSGSTDGSGLAAMARIVKPDGTPISNEFVVNTYTSADQAAPSVATLQDGSFIILYGSLYQDGSDWGIYGQKYSIDGLKTGPAFLVNTTTYGAQFYPAISGLKDGGFIATWTATATYGGDGNGSGVYGQIFNSDGSKRGGEFRINKEIQGFQEQTQTCVLNNGNIVITYANNASATDAIGNGYFYKIISPDGLELVADTRISLLSRLNLDCMVTALGNGGFAVTWTEPTANNYESEIYFSIYDQAGNTVISRTMANQTSNGDQLKSDIAYIGNDHIFITWQGSGETGEIYGREFSATTGAPLANEYVINSVTAGSQKSASIASSQDGNAAITWLSAGTNTSADGIYFGDLNTQGTLAAITGNGSFNEGVKLTAGTISGDPEGNGIITAYQWYLNNNLISGATSSTYDVSATGFGTYKVEVTYTDGQGYSTTLTSADQVVAKIDNGNAVVSISGNAVVGSTLTASITTADPDGNGSFTYQWQSFSNNTWSNIANATATSYVLTSNELNKSVRVVVTSTDAQTYGPIAINSTSTSPVAPPPDTLAPTVTSIAVQGTTVILSFSEQITATSVPVTAFTVQTLSGATAATRTISSVALDQNDATKIVLTLTGTAPAANVNLRVSYTDPAGNQTSGVVQDLAGNDLASFSNVFATTFSTASTSTIANQYQTLNLTGTSAINGTGNTLNNTISGNSANNTLSGLDGIDTITGAGGNDTIVGGLAGDLLTGGTGTDTFRLALADSLLASYDRITDFAIGTDRIDGPNTVTTTNVAELGTVNTLDEAGISTVLTTATFLANRAASFTYGSGNATRTFVALNNNVAGFQAGSDAIVEITGYSGLLTDLAIV